MSTAADQLLDGMMTAAEDGQPTDDRIILSIDEPSRTIKYDGELILGVKGDRFAERIYFRCPQQVYKEESRVIDLTLPTTKIYIDYKNAYNETYIEECFKHGLENDKYIFSWFVSDHVTPKDGTVSFNVCVKDESEDLKDNDDNVIIKEWHTTTFRGIVLPAVDVSSNTPEVITSDTVTSAEIISEYNRLTTELSGVDGYIDSEVASQIGAVLDSRVIYINRIEYETYNDYTTDFDFNTFDASNSEQYVCVVVGRSSGNNTDTTLSIAQCTVYSSMTMLKFSNGEFSLNIEYEPLDNNVVIYETSMVAPIAQQVYQFVANDDDLHDSEFPLLISDYDGYVDGVRASGILETSKISANPLHGSVSANSFIENGKPLSDKYVLKDQHELKEYTLTITANGILSNETTGPVRMKYSFDLQHDTVVNIFPKAKYIKISDPNNNMVYTFSVKGFDKHYNSINNYRMNISGSLYYDDECNEFSVFIGYYRIAETAYENHLVMQIPVSSYQSHQFVFPILYDSQNPESCSKVVILYEE